MWNPGMDPKWDRWDPALDCRWEAAFTLDPGWKAGSQVGPWAGLAGSRLGSQVRGGIPPRILGGRRDPTLDPGWEVGSQVGPQVGKAGSRQWWRVGLAGSNLNPAHLFTWVVASLQSVKAFDKMFLLAAETSKVREELQWLSRLLSPQTHV